MVTKVSQGMGHTDRNAMLSQRLPAKDIEK
jgi:hypothetical protein